MSFENKGFPNDLNSRYEALNEKAKYYEGYETIPSGILRLKPVPIPAYNPQPLTVKTPLSLQTPSASTISPDTLRGATIGTEASPTNLPEYVVTAPKKKSKTIYYIISALILLLAIYFIIKYTTKKQ